MTENTRKALEKVARKTAKRIRRETLPSGMYEDESRFPKCDYEYVISMLEEAYEMGKKEGQE